MSHPDRPRRFAVIPTYNRPEVLLRTLRSIQDQADAILVIDNGDDPNLRAPNAMGKWERFEVPMRPPNLSRLWNVGLDICQQHAYAHRYERWDVAVLNDDAIIPPYWFNAIATYMRQLDCYAGSSGSPVGIHVHRIPGTTPLHLRMQGHAFVLRGEAGLRADERFQWWCGDNDLDMQARKMGGTVIIGGYPVEHLHPDQSTVGELAARTAVDMALFVEKWGWRPW